MMIFAEFAALVSAPDFPEAIRKLPRRDLEERFGEDFAQMLGYDQENPHHCYDLLEHTLHTAQALHVADLSGGQRLALYAAALLHDVGKPCVGFYKKGRKVFYGHPKESAAIARPLLRQMGFDDSLAAFICFLIEYHDFFINHRLPHELGSNPYFVPITPERIQSDFDAIGDHAFKAYGFRPSLEDMLLLCRLCAADAAAQAEVVRDADGRIVSRRADKVARVERIADCLAALKAEQDA